MSTPMIGVKAGRQGREEGQRLAHILCLGIRHKDSLRSGSWLGVVAISSFLEVALYP